MLIPFDWDFIVKIIKNYSKVTFFGLIITFMSVIIAQLESFNNINIFGRGVISIVTILISIGGVTTAIGGVLVSLKKSDKDLENLKNEVRSLIIFYNESKNRVEELDGKISKIFKRMNISEDLDEENPENLNYNSREE